MPLPLLVPATVVIVGEETLGHDMHVHNVSAAMVTEITFFDRWTVHFYYFSV